jgi:phage shock protein PspC (stress-responsive transcriptional regulator)
MDHVITIALNGKAYTLEIPGHEKLRVYLDAASRTLEHDPDRDEILKDLEQALGEKCAASLREGQETVSAADIERILAEMGPVESAAAAQPAPETSATSTAAPRRAPKKFYILRDEAKVSGVCAGIAAYLGLDAVIVRIAFVLLTLFTTGFWILVYFGLLLFVPHAKTLEQRAEAHGEPFSAQHLVERAKVKYAQFRASQRTA